MKWTTSIQWYTLVAYTQLPTSNIVFSSENLLPDTQSLRSLLLDTQRTCICCRTPWEYGDTGRIILLYLIQMEREIFKKKNKFTHTTYFFLTRPGLVWIRPTPSEWEWTVSREWKWTGSGSNQTELSYKPMNTRAKLYFSLCFSPFAMPSMILSLWYILESSTCKSSYIWIEGRKGQHTRNQANPQGTNFC